MIDGDVNIEIVKAYRSIIIKLYWSKDCSLAVNTLPKNYFFIENFAVKSYNVAV